MLKKGKDMSKTSKIIMLIISIALSLAVIGGLLFFRTGLVNNFTDRAKDRLIERYSKMIETGRLEAMPHFDNSRIDE